MSRSHRDVVRVAASALWARLALLGTLALAGATLAHGDFVVFAYLLGVASAVQVMVDPSATASYLVATGKPGRGVGRRRLAMCLRYQFALCAFVVLVPVLVAALTTGELRWMAVALVLGGLSAAETLVRLARVTWQVAGDFRRFARVDQLVGLGRAAAALTLPLGLGWIGFAAVCAVAAFVALWVLTRAVRTAATEGLAVPPGVRGAIGELWPYTAGSLTSSLYSQAPTVLVGVLGSVPMGAVYSIATRLTQPTELVPAALASVGLPRLRRERGAALARTFRTQLATGVGLGVVVAATTIAVAPWVLPVLGTRAGEAVTVVAFLALALPFKFGSYQLVSLAVATDRVRSRLACSAIVASVSVTATLFAVGIGVVEVAAVALGSEILLALLLVRITWRTSMRPAHRPLVAR